MGIRGLRETSVAWENFVFKVVSEHLNLTYWEFTDLRVVRLKADKLLDPNTSMSTVYFEMENLYTIVKANGGNLFSWEIMPGYTVEAHSDHITITNPEGPARLCGPDPLGNDGGVRFAYGRWPQGPIYELLTTAFNKQRKIPLDSTGSF